MKRALSVSVVVTVLPLLCTVFSPGLCAQRDWPITVLDSSGDVGQHIDMRIDSDGYLHIVYVSLDTGTVKVISQETAGWSLPAEIDTGSNEARDCAIATTADGQLPVSFRRHGMGTLHFAGPAESKSWAWEPITTEADDVGRELSAILDPSGTIALGFRNETEATLLHMCREAGAWSAIDIVNSTPEQSDDIDLAYRPGIGYAFSAYADDSGHLSFADPQIEAQTNEWTIAPITASAEDLGRELSVIHTGGSDLALSFRNESTDALEHMRRESGVWSGVETVDDNGDRGHDNDLVKRPVGGFAFSGYDSDGDFLIFADPEIAPASWDTTPLTTVSDDVGQYLSGLGVGGTDLAFSFRNETVGTLQHMRRESGEWSAIETVDDGSDRGLDNDLARRPGGDYCFSAYVNDGDRLAFADPEIQAAQWNIESVDHHVDVGRQLTMIKGQNGCLDYTYIGLDEHSGWHVRAGEYLPDSVRVLSTVIASVSEDGDGDVSPDLFVTTDQDWAVSYLDDTDGFLYMATTTAWQVELAAVPDPDDDDGIFSDSGSRLNSVSTPVTHQLRIRFVSETEAPVITRIFDTSGRLMTTHESTSRRGANVVDCDTRDGFGTSLSGGVYFVSLQVGSRDLGTKRFVLVR
jgi:hypothetical protein